MAQQTIHKFTLGTKELEGKTAEFQYDRGNYSITDIVGEERNLVYKSRNAQEAYIKWNVYIGRRKERPHNESQNRGENQENRFSGENPARAERQENRFRGENQIKNERQEGRTRSETKSRNERQEKRPRKEAVPRMENEHPQGKRTEGRSRRESRPHSENRQRGGANRRRYERQIEAQE